MYKQQSEATDLVTWKNAKLVTQEEADKIKKAARERYEGLAELHGFSGYGGFGAFMFGDGEDYSDDGGW